MVEHPEILIVEDEPIVSALLDKFLSSGYNISIASTLKKAQDYLNYKNFDILILDLNISGESGFELIKYLKSKNINKDSLSVIVLTSSDDMDNQIEGHNLGVSDYLIKPPKKELLKSVIEKNLNKKGNVVGAIKYKEISFDPKTLSFFVENNESIDKVTLSSKQYKILYYLIKYAGMVLTRTQILENIHLDSLSVSSPRSIDVHINHLRKSHLLLEKYIETIHGVGYVFNKKD